MRGLDLQRFHERKKDFGIGEAQRTRKGIINDLRETQREATVAAKWTSRRAGPTTMPASRARLTGDSQPDGAEANPIRRGASTQRDGALEAQEQDMETGAQD